MRAKDHSKKSETTNPHEESPRPGKNAPREAVVAHARKVAARLVGSGIPAPDMGTFMRSTRDLSALLKGGIPVVRTHAPSLQRFTLEDLAPFTKEGTFSDSASRDFHLFYVGRDDVHGILKYLLSRATTSLYLNMFGYDDEELNAECMRCVTNASVTTVITLDKTQAGGKHEKAILDSDVATDPVAFNTHVVIGQSATHQITHTKGGVLDGRVGFEGSTNWSASGEGTFVMKGQPGGPGYKAQNNTLAVFTDPDTIARFTAELVAEHLAARGAGVGTPAPTSRGKRRAGSATTR